MSGISPLSSRGVSPKLAPIIVIPARLGSKRIPGKNLADFLGSPIIAKPLGECFKFSRRSKARIIVSSDDCGLVKAKLSNQIDPKYLSRLEWHERDQSLSDDFATTAQVIREVIRELKVGLSTPIFCVYPTSVFLKSEYLSIAVEKLENETCDFVSSAVEMKNYDRALRIKFESGFLTYVRPEKSEARTQDLTAYFEDAAQLYLGLAGSWLGGAPFESRTLPIFLQRGHVWDIDEPPDWPVAEALWQLNFGSNTLAGAE